MTDDTLEAQARALMRRDCPHDPNASQHRCRYCLATWARRLVADSRAGALMEARDFVQRACESPRRTPFGVVTDWCGDCGWCRVAAQLETIAEAEHADLAAMRGVVEAARQRVEYVKPRGRGLKHITDVKLADALDALAAEAEPASQSSSS